MFLNFCQMADIIKIQNETFKQELSENEFQPKKLIQDILNETKELFDYEIELRMDQMPKVLLGDNFRINYILHSLI